jgi:hypothetical protein
MEFLHQYALGGSDRQSTVPSVVSQFKPPTNILLLTGESCRLNKMIADYDDDDDDDDDDDIDPRKRICTEEMPKLLSVFERFIA